MDEVLVNPDKFYPGVSITTNGKFIRIETDFGLVVESDGVWTGTVRIPSTYSGKMAGLCQNANHDVSDDLTLKDGTDVSADPRLFSLIGNSMQIYDPEQPRFKPLLFCITNVYIILNY